MTNLIVPQWCRTLIEQSNEAYVFTKNDKIAFLNEKAWSIVRVLLPDLDGCIGLEAFLENKRLNIVTKQTTSQLAVHAVHSDFIKVDHDKEVSTCDNFSVELLFSDNSLKILKLKENPKPGNYFTGNDQCFYSLFNTVKDAIFIQDRDGVILEANLGAEKMYGYPSAYFKGKTPAAFSAYATDDNKQINVSLEKAFQGEPQKLEFWGKRSTGEIFPKEIYLYKGNFFGKDVVIALATDITSRKRTEAQFEAYTIQLHELIETRDKIYSIVAHDLRSSFSSILGLSELLTEDWESIEDDRKKVFAKNIFIAADGSYKLLQNLLDWSKNQSGLLEYEPVSFDMCGVINEILSLYRIQSTQKNIIIVSEVTTPTFVYADVNMVQSILRNLISNAIKFTPENGRVWVTICDADSGNSVNMVCLSVHDNGVGISKERIEKLFDSKINSTTTGTANEQGTGLGILICKEMAEKNQGKLWVESEEGIGSTFSFTLPLTKHL
jgi:PAS domain S-box-containing protein